MNTFAPINTHGIRLVSPPCTLGITDGSERGSYVDQVHMLKQIGRPHHVVNLMFQYYPNLENWPTQGINWHGFYRNNDLNMGDGYFPLVLEPGGQWGQEYLRQIEDVRAHGQEPLLTLTLLPTTSEEELRSIARSLAPYGPMRIRINHECNGTWFYFNLCSSYKQVSDLFIRFHNIIHEEAPNVRTVACWNGKGESYKNPTGKVSGGTLDEDQLGPMFRTADIVSYDQYASLHWAWPDPDYDSQNPTGCFNIPMDVWWTLIEEVYENMCRLRNEDVALEVHEVNEDANVVGLDAQAQWVREFYQEVVDRKLPWLTNITQYMFRDRGGLGLEKEDVNDSNVFTEVPALQAYRDAIKDPWFALRTEPVDENASSELDMRWLNSTDAEGLEFVFDHPSHSDTAHLVVGSDDHLLIGTGDRWTVKPAGQVRIEAPLSERIQIFAPPADGKSNAGNAFAATMTQPPAWEID